LTSWNRTSKLACGCTTQQQSCCSVGALVDVAYVEELRPSPDHTDARISWTVHPGHCVIRWDYIITVQRMADAPAPIDPRPAPGLYL